MAELLIQLKYLSFAEKLHLMRELVKSIEKDSSIAFNLDFSKSPDLENGIVAFTASGLPLTQVEFIARVRNAFEAAQNGKTVSSESLLTELETW